ncbi:DUF58 domain-containing protein [Segniliparus rugosus]|uniref:DUF58 domain-containing protein n=1 Tax=Segniliparus rugosus (strain ATCC BAA-974 / DSM 45345 / CCUG 50838 / CIP 108380 / JCM 13579 / CDC 945) TaxID=679197 RepID=E5XSC0_SEGRC|nr:DUF58 domain-containing protein [Segniliparus rugosus]EFV12740.2 hypothetical protein HMPREF9336_02392 [Segniliparus rugosus ATCC BAA-974]
MVLTWRAGLAVACGALAVLLLPRPELVSYAVVGLVALLALVDVALAGSPKKLAFARSGDEVARLGETARVRLEVENLGGRAVRGFVRDAWAPSAAASPWRHRAHLRAGERLSVETLLRPIRRGEQHAAKVTVRSFGPLGFAGRQRSVEVPWRLRALPPFLARKHLPSRLSRLRELEGQTLSLLRGQGTEFDSLREYVDGDDVRSIDWRASARRGDVLVRTWRPERDQQILIVLDCGRTSAGRIGVDPLSADPSGWPRLDWSMDAALLLAALASKAGDKVGFLAYDRETRGWIGSSTAAGLLPAMVQAMAPLEPSLVEVDAEGLVETVLARSRRRSLVVLLTDLSRSAFEESWLPVLGHLTLHHHVLLAAVADPRLAELAEGRGDAERVYRAGAAERMRADRGFVAQELRAMGVEVIDELPERFAPALADKYIAMKATGKL